MFRYVGVLFLSELSNRIQTILNIIECCKNQIPGLLNMCDMQGLGFSDVLIGIQGFEI